MPLFFVYNIFMKKDRKLTAFIVPTGIGANIGGYAGDAGFWARRFAKHSDLIVNPNVVNAGCFSAITENMLYVEGYSLDEFFKGNLYLKKSVKNKVGVIFDKSIPKDVLNIHINTLNAVRVVYDIDIIYETTQEAVGVEFYVDETKISTGLVNNTETILNCAKELKSKGADALAIVCRFDEDTLNDDYENGVGVDPIGGVEAIISHYISKEMLMPAAHAPAFDDFSISTNLVNPKSAAEYITPTFLPCILIGLANAPRLTKEKSVDTISIDDLDYLIMPYNSLGAVPVFEALKRKIPVYAIAENTTVLDVTKNNLHLDDIIVTDSYQSCLELIAR